jgi:phosphoribosylformylglycinamidine synthase subunit PurQ / glutaminase
MTAKVGVVVFPGSNCEHDVVEAIDSLGEGATAELLWHGDTSLGGCDAVVIPGGFAHGDYLRPGALARFSPIMASVTSLAKVGGPVVGICNGFQVLTETGLLPGALIANGSLRFICQPTDLEVVSTRSVLTSGATVGQRLRIPINHYMGNFTCDGPTLDRLIENDQIVLRYLDNPNGSRGSIAGVSNEAGNVVGLMPHPERASDPVLGSADGRVLLRALVASACARAGTPA